MAERGAVVETSHEYAHVFGIYVPIAIGVFALVLVLTLAAVVVYRRRSPGEAARWHEHNPIEAGYAVLLACIVAFLLYVSFSAEHQVDAVARKQRPVLTVNVFGARWEWHFQYPRYGIDRYSGTVGREPLVVPAGEPVAYRLIALDVIHEFWVPELKYKHDLIPGMAQTEILTFAHPGFFQGHCGEFCGLFHTRMVFSVRVLEPAQFQDWLARSRRPAGPAAGPAAAAGNGVGA